MAFTIFVAIAAFVVGVVYHVKVANELANLKAKLTNIVTHLEGAVSNEENALREDVKAAILYLKAKF